MEHDTVAALRRVAIVLSSLPEATAGRLIQSLGSEQQRAVRMAMSGLDDVDPLERRRTLDGFATSLRRGSSPLAGHNDAAEIVLSKTALQHADARAGEPRSDWRRPAAEDAPAHTPPLAFLSGVDDEALAEQVREEHPQTIAIVLASIAPTQAARVLTKLSVTTRTETMRRLAKLSAPSPEVIDDIGSQLKHKLLASNASWTTQRTPAASSHTSVGQATLQAILAEMPAADAHPLRRPASGQRPQGTASEPLFSGPTATGIDAASHTATATEAVGEVGRGAAVEQPSIDLAQPTASSADSTDAVHARLVALPAEQLRQALALLPTRQSLLALCGLPNATAQQLLASLPRRQARHIRQQITDLGSLELSEIDRAKAAAARAAESLEKPCPSQFADAA